MKFTPAQIERMALWAVVLILIVVVVFAQRRSGYVPATGQPISLMDLQEYSSLTETQKSMYRNELSKELPNLNAIITNPSSSPLLKFSAYTTKLTGILNNTFKEVPAAPVPPPSAAAPVPPPVM